MRINIIVESNPYYSSSAGGNRWLSLINGLRVYDVDIHLIITGGYTDNEEWKKLGKSGFLSGIKYTYLLKSINSNIWMRRVNRYLINPVITPLLFLKALSLIKKENPDIIWSSSQFLPIKLVFWLRNRVRPVRFFLEMSEFLDIHRYNLGNALQRREGDRRQQFFEKKAFYAYDGIALMTRTLLEYYRDFPGNKPELLHLPMTVDLERFTPSVFGSVAMQLKKPYIAFVGVMDNRKDGVNILIDAFARIAGEFPDYYLHLFGYKNYDTPGHLEQIKTLGLENRVFWHGQVSRDEIPAILQGSEVLALPRPPSKQAQGGFPTKLGEYLASARPVCVTTVGEIPDYLTDNESSFFAEPGSVDSFASALRRALTDRENALRVGINGQKVAEKHFNKDIQAKILHKFLQELIQDDPK